MFPGALGETGTRAAGGLRRAALAAFVAAIAAPGLAACGGGGERQDEDEPEGEFPVEITSAQFPNRQRLAETADLKLGVQNTGTEEIPDLAITIFVDEGSGAVSSGAGGQGSFSIRSDQPGLANPSRPVWVLENKYPRIEGQAEPLGSSPGTTAQTNTFDFGPLPPGEAREMIWRVTPVRGGTYTLHYEVAAGLQGKAVAVTSDGTAPESEFVVTISTRPPKARVNDAGEVVVQE